MPSRGRLLKILLGLAVSAGLLVYVFRDADVHAIPVLLARTHWGLLAASIALNLLSLWFRARRWAFLFPPGAHPVHLFSAVMIGYMGNNLLPLRAGEVVRAYVVARRGQRFWTTVATMVVERVLDAIAVGLMLAGLFLLVTVPRELRWAALVFISADLALIVALAVVAIAPGRCERVLGRLLGRWPAVEGRARGIFATVNEGLSGIRAPHHLLPIVFWSAGIWLLLATVVWTAFRAAHLALPWGAAWAVLALLGLGVSLPSSPGFAGVVQAVVVVALALFSVPRTEALSFSLLLHASQYFPVTLWGLALLFVEHVSLADAARTTGVAPPSLRT
ncbi:MAG: flippase-like domain-containing protein [Candidatus Rokubacteria bacterium]|nr:flippase-like domain-containing protein [Candidatus Rokubacteria bacterium]